MAYMTMNPNTIEPHEGRQPFACPECGEPLDYGNTIYMDDFGVIVGCEYCVTAKSAEDVFDDH